MDIRDEDLRAIARVWHELAEIPAAHSDEALTHCFAQLARIIGASNVFWVGAARATEVTSDRLRGWRPRAVRHLHRDAMRDRIVADLQRQFKANAVDPQTQALVTGAGTTRAFLRRQLVDNETWESSWILNEGMRPLGIEHRLVGAHAVNPRVETYIGLDRGRREQPFAERERDLLYLFLLGCPGFHREQALAHGVAQPSLTAREREVLHLLLTDLSEREIGQALGLTWRSTHQYVVAVLKKFGVKGRVGLMAHWLRHRSNGAPP
jgi:DNA-binding CsgD family transcriptional regulator